MTLRSSRFTRLGWAFMLVSALLSVVLNAQRQEQITFFTYWTSGWSLTGWSGGWSPGWRGVPFKWLWEGGFGFDRHFLLVALAADGLIAALFAFTFAVVVSRLERSRSAWLIALAGGLGVICGVMLTCWKRGEGIYIASRGIPVEWHAWCISPARDISNWFALSADILLGVLLGCLAALAIHALAGNKDLRP